jgi:hypothetical protein
MCIAANDRREMSPWVITAELTFSDFVRCAPDRDHQSRQAPLRICAMFDIVAVRSFLLFLRGIRQPELHRC